MNVLFHVNFARRFQKRSRWFSYRTNTYIPETRSKVILLLKKCERRKILMAPTPVTLPEICILLTCADCPDLPLYRNFVNRHRKMQRLRIFKIMTPINYLLLLTSFIIATLHSGPIRFAVSLQYLYPSGKYKPPFRKLRCSSRTGIMWIENFVHNT